MLGKHTNEGVTIRQLKETIQLKDKEIKDIKHSLSDILLQIRNLNECNNCGDPSVIRRKISELCTNTRYELLIDEIENSNEDDKIIELPTNRKIRR